MKEITDVTILHGYGVTPQKMWFPWLHRELEERGLPVRVPAMPEPLNPDYRKWRKAALPIARTWGPGTLVIGHSVGGAFALRLLERDVKTRIAGVVLVGSPFTATINVKPYVRFFAMPMDWQRVRDMAEQFHVLHAKNDPFVPYDHAVRYAEALGSNLTLVTKGGHFIEKECEPLKRVLNRKFLSR